MASLAQKGEERSSSFPQLTSSALHGGSRIPVSAAAGLTVLYTVFYIAPFYISPTLRSTSLSNRNNPAVIKARIRAVGLTCLLCTAINVLVLVGSSGATAYDVLRMLGIYPIHLVDVAKCLLLVAVLFVGPLFEVGIAESQWRYWYQWRYIKETIYDDWQGWRNILLGPASEELVFRSLAISLFQLAGSSPIYITFVSPLIFGLAHLHHLHEFIVSKQRPDATYLETASTPSVLIPGVVRSLVMFMYTSLFGFFEAFVYLRTGNVWSCFVAHAFCNCMGLPRFLGRVGKGLGKATNAEAPVSAAMQDVANEIHPESEEHDLGIEWTVVYYVLLCVGAYAFKALLFPLTESDLALGTF
ncbi:hypothetical protein AAFC00_005271 [Neodothiora populina]|uniref:intramembrane prenyl-peptidase Rce1 n=1 Tax=Neodothiora populina TaxID=2781224 RepID=A0ABR3PKC1_9PEZI